MKQYQWLILAIATVAVWLISPTSAQAGCWGSGPDFSTYYSSWACAGSGGAIPSCTPDPSVCFDAQSQGSFVSCQPSSGATACLQDIYPVGWSQPPWKPTPQEKLDAYLMSKSIEQSCIMILKTIPRLTHPVVKAATYVTYRMCLRAAAKSMKRFADPPDPDFTVYPPFTPPVVVQVVPDGALTPAMANAVNAWNQAMANQIGRWEQANASMEKGAAAHEAGDLAWFQRQTAFANAVSQIIRLEGINELALRAAFSAFPSVSVPFEHVTTQEAQEAEGFLIADGASPEEIDIFNRFYVDTAVQPFTFPGAFIANASGINYDVIARFRAAGQSGATVTLSALGHHMTLTYGGVLVPDPLTVGIYTSTAPDASPMLLVTPANDGRCGAGTCHVTMAIPQTTTYEARVFINGGFLAKSAPLALIGTGARTVGIFRPATTTWYLRTANVDGPPNITIVGWGAPEDLPVAGDWTHTGVTGFGVYRPSTNTYYLRNTNVYGAPDITIAFWGAPGDLPLVGDWTGQGIDTIGLYRPSTNTFYLRNSNTYGAPDIIIAGIGGAGDIPLVGDWNGDGITTFGLYRPSTNTFYLWNTNAYGSPDITIASWGAPGDIPVVGDWDGNGTTSIGVYRPSTGAFYLRNTNTYGPHDVRVYLGGTGDRPVIGHWVP